MPNIVRDAKNGIYKLPVFGGAADVARGAFMKRGATPGTNNGMLIAATGNSAHPDIIGRMLELLDYSVEAETLLNGTAFVTKPIAVANPFRIHRIEYDQSTTITATQAVNSTTITLTNLEDNIDAAFLYVVSGTGAGQTNYLTASASGSATLKAAFGTDLDTSSGLIKILPRFHQLVSLSSDGTKLSNQAAAGSMNATVIDTHIERNGRLAQMDPTKHDALTGLDGLASLKFWADVSIIDSIPYSIA